MLNLNVWIILGIISIILLIFYFHSKRRNAVWGGFTLGLIIGFIIAIFLYFQGDGFIWYAIVKGAIAGTILGFIAELLGMVGDLIKKHKTK